MHFGRPFVKVLPMQLDRCPVRLSVCPVMSVTLVYCGQKAGWMKMSLGMEVGLGLGPGHIVLDGDSAPRTERSTAAPPSFQPTLLRHSRPSQQLLSSCVLLNVTVYG